MAIELTHRILHSYETISPKEAFIKWSNYLTTDIPAPTTNSVLEHVITEFTTISMSSNGLKTRTGTSAFFAFFAWTVGTSASSDILLSQHFADLATVTVALAYLHNATNNASNTFNKVKRSEEHTSELQSPCNLVCRLLLEKKKP